MILIHESTRIKLTNELVKYETVEISVRIVYQIVQPNSVLGEIV